MVLRGRKGSCPRRAAGYIVICHVTGDGLPVALGAGRFQPALPVYFDRRHARKAPGARPAHPPGYPHLQEMLQPCPPT